MKRIGFLALEEKLFEIVDGEMEDAECLHILLAQFHNSQLIPFPRIDTTSVLIVEKYSP